MKMTIRMLLGFVALSIFLAACSTGPTSAKAPVIRSATKDGVVRVACVGDSITFGAGVEGRETNSYPAVLGSLLGARFKAGNFGVSGATLLKKGDLPYWQTPAFNEVTEFGPDVVIIKLGTNDSKPQNWKNGAEFMTDLRAMVDHFTQLKSHPQVWLCLPVPVYEDKWGITAEVVQEEIIPNIQQVADEKKLPVIDLNAGLSNHRMLFPDGIHPNAEGAALMARIIKDALVSK